MKGDIFACFSKKQYYYLNMKKSSLALFFLVMSLAPALAQNYKMHSVFIYSFTRYVQWPDAYNQGEFEILVLGDSPILAELKAMAQAKKVGDRVIIVTKIKSPAEIRKCNMLLRMGMTLEQVVAAEPTADLDAQYGSPERLIPAFYNSIKAGL
jgi:hypothetical protein